MTETHCLLCGFQPNSTSPRRISAAILLHQRAKHGITPDGEIRDCQHTTVHHEHGTNPAYVDDGCRCAPCRNANLARQAKRRRQTAYGKWDRGHVPADAARAHVLSLREQGMNMQRIADTAGVPYPLVKCLVYGRGKAGPAKRLRAVSEKLILAVEPDTHHARYTDSTGTMRRIQAMTALGYGFAEIARRVQSSSANLQDIAHGRSPKVERRTEAAIRALYDDLWGHPNEPTDRFARSAATTARGLAARNGWAPPLAWDDDTIDDPASEPNLGEKPDRADQATVEDLEFLYRLGVDPVEAARRIGKGRHALRSAATRQGRSDLALYIIRGV